MSVGRMHEGNGGNRGALTAGPATGPTHECGQLITTQGRKFPQTLKTMLASEGYAHVYKKT